MVQVKRKQAGGKEQALRVARILNPRPGAVTDEQFLAVPFFDARDVVQVKYEMVRRVQVDGLPVAHAVAAFGFSRPSYYEAAAALEREGLQGLLPDKPGPRGGHKLSGEVITHARALIAANASLRAADLVEALAAAFGVQVHPRSIERALARPQEGRSGPKSG